MAKKSFKDQVAESLSQSDVSVFREVIKRKLNESFTGHQKQLFINLTEENDPETSMVTAVQSASKSYGGYDFNYDQGVLEVTVPGKTASLQFAEYLDGNVDVDSYEVNPTEGSEGTPVDLEDETGGDDIDYTFSVFFVTDNVNFDPVEIEEKKCDEEEEPDEDEKGGEDEDDEEELKESRFEGISARGWLSEAKKVVTFRAGLKKIKMQCPPGQKWNASENKCVIMNAAENRKRHLKGLVGAKKRMSKMSMIVKKRAKSLAKRVAAGF